MKIDECIEAVHAKHRLATLEAQAFDVVGEIRLVIYMNCDYFDQCFCEIGNSEHYQITNMRADFYFGQTLLGFKVYPVKDVSHPDFLIFELESKR
jgi:hypothetical protein